MKIEIVPSSTEDKEWVTEQLIAFNRTFLPLPREEYIVPLNFHLRNQDNIIIAGVNAFMLAKATVYVGILWVDEKYRGKDYGSYLLQHVENEAKKSGTMMIHRDTFDFQARGFYVKCGYEEFAALQNSPAAGNTRFYMKKVL